MNQAWFIKMKTNAIKLKSNEPSSSIWPFYFTTFVKNGERWFITRNINGDKWQAIRHGVRLSGFKSLDDLLFALNNRLPWPKLNRVN